jgi:hypothetical protein
MKMKYIWIIYDDDSNAITAPTWKAAIHGWIDKWRVTGDVTPVFDEVLNACDHSRICMAMIGNPC